MPRRAPPLRGTLPRKEDPMPCGRIGSTELLVLALLLLVLFGGSRLPGLGRGLGLGIRRVKKSLREDEDEGTERKRVDKDKDKKDE